jgi:hypothetical protein
MTDRAQCLRRPQDKNPASHQPSSREKAGKDKPVEPAPPRLLTGTLPAVPLSLPLAPPNVATPQFINIHT